MDWLLNEAKATGEHTLKRTLGPVSLTALGVGAIIGAGIFVLSGLGRALRRSGPDALVRDFRIRLRVRGTLLRGICGADSAGGQRLHIRVCRARRTFRVDHRLGPDARIRHGCEHGFVGLVESLHRVPEYFRAKNAALARVRPLDGPAHRGEYCRPADGARFRSEPRCGHAGVSRRRSATFSARSPRN